MSNDQAGDAESAVSEIFKIRHKDVLAAMITDYCMMIAISEIERTDEPRAAAIADRYPAFQAEVAKALELSQFNLSALNVAERAVSAIHKQCADLLQTAAAPVLKARSVGASEVYTGGTINLEQIVAKLKLGQLLSACELHRLLVMRRAAIVALGERGLDGSDAKWMFEEDV